MDEEIAQRLALAISQSKTVEREARILKQMLGGLRDNLQSTTQGEPNDHSSQED